MTKRTSGQPYRVLVHGLTYFCRKLPALLSGDGWDVRDHSRHRALRLPALVYDLNRADLVYLWGGRITIGKFLAAARSLRKRKIIMLWSGSDVLFAKEQLACRKLEPWIAEKIHWAVSATLADEVRSLGLACEYVQASFVNPVAHPKPLPEKFSVLLYVPSLESANLYGWDTAVQVAERLRSIQFNLVGLKAGERLDAPPNVTVHNWVSDLIPIIDQTSVLWRPVRHDAGTSFMVLEALAHGRHVLYTYPHPGCIRAATIEAARSEIERLHALHDSGELELNRIGIEYVGRDCSRSKVRSEILRRWEEVILSPALSGTDRLVDPALPTSPQRFSRNSN